MATHLKLIISACLLVIVLLGTRVAKSQLFPIGRVPVVTIAQMRKIQLDPELAKRYVVVDVRTPAETSVSMIPGAITVTQFKERRAEFDDRIVIAYCTVGYRSGKYAKEQIRQDVDSRNFKGSIVEWCAAKYPLVTPTGEPTTRVHLYDERYHAPSGYEAVYFDSNSDAASK